MNNPYQTLGVTPRASAVDIRRAYKHLAQRLHPDRATGDADEFKRVKEAYEILSDLDLRAHYDRTGEVNKELPLDNKASEAIATVFMKIAGQMGWRNHDYLNEMRRYFDNQVQASRSELLGRNRMIDMLTNLELPKYVGDNNVLSGAVAQQQALLRTQIELIKSQIEVYERAIEMLNDYNYLVINRIAG